MMLEMSPLLFLPLLSFRPMSSHESCGTLPRRTTTTFTRATTTTTTRLLRTTIARSSLGHS